MNFQDIAQRYTFRAMGSEIQLWLDSTNPKQAQRAFDSVMAYFEAVEQVFSRFRAQSELSRLNSRTGTWVVVSPEFWDVLNEALRMAELTNGFYDPLLLNAVEEAGYTSSFESLNQLVTRATRGIPNGGGWWQKVQMDPEKQAVWLPQQARLGLDGLVKGYTAALAVEMLSNCGPCLVDAGGDVTAGAAPEGYPGWPVAIAAPGATESADLLTLWLADASLATSGTDYRRWEHNGRIAHHIIDPRTGLPAETDLLTVSVLLKQAVQAEAVATAVLVMGEQVGFDWLADRRIPALLVSQSGHIRTTPAMEAACCEAPLFLPAR